MLWCFHPSGPVPSHSGQDTCHRSANHSLVPSSGAYESRRAHRERHAFPESAIRARRAVLRWLRRVWPGSIWTRKCRVPEGIATTQSVPAVFRDPSACEPVFLVSWGCSLWVAARGHSDGCPLILRFQRRFTVCRHCPRWLVDVPGVFYEPGGVVEARTGNVAVDFHKIDFICDSTH